jgi:hypothetical protein
MGSARRLLPIDPPARECVVEFFGQYVNPALALATWLVEIGRYQDQQGVDRSHSIDVHDDAESFVLALGYPAPDSQWRGAPGLHSPRVA